MQESKIQNLNFQARIKQNCQYLFLTKQESNNKVISSLHTKQEQSKITVAREGSIMIGTRFLTPTAQYPFNPLNKQ